jgi:hypothetical protein
VSVGSPVSHSPELEAGLVTAYLAAIRSSLVQGQQSCWLKSATSDAAVPGPGRVYSLMFYLQGALQIILISRTCLQRALPFAIY